VPSRRRRVREALQDRLPAVESLTGVVAAADAVLRGALGAEGSAWGTVDPATTLSTSCARFGALDTGPEGWAVAAARERRLFELEWADDAVATFWDLARRGTTAAGLRAAVPDPRGIRRFDELLEPAGVHDELRVRLAVDGEQWGTAILYRFGARPFTAEDVAVAAAAAPLVARAVRTALLRAVCDSPHVESPPGSVLLGRDGEVVVSSAAAEELLAGLAPQQAGTVLANLAATTRARGATSLTVTVPGGLLAFHASAAKGVDDAVAAVVERPRTVELAPWIMRAVGFTAREREVAEALLNGASRTQLARRLRVSEHTVGDHLQNLYRKAGVTGRAELAALLYGRWYEGPRSAGIPPSPYGWFVDGGAAVSLAGVERGVS
jgi:DNA-binding CsgD family transcriptional regulator